jgi:hypothetical protein
MKEISDEKILKAMAPHLNAADGGYVVDYSAQSVVDAGRAAIALAIGAPIYQFKRLGGWFDSCKEDCEFIASKGGETRLVYRPTGEQ